MIQQGYLKWIMISLSPFLLAGGFCVTIKMASALGKFPMELVIIAIVQIL